MCLSFLIKERKKLGHVDFASAARGVRGNKRRKWKKKKKKKKQTGNRGIPPVILHEIVEGHFGSYTFGGTCTQISWNELGKPSSCGIVNCRYFVSCCRYLSRNGADICWTILVLLESSRSFAIGITISRVSFKWEERILSYGMVVLLSIYWYRVRSSRLWKKYKDRYGYGHVNV